MTLLSVPLNLGVTSSPGLQHGHDWSGRQECAYEGDVAPLACVVASA
jgi:hypothetical protein